MRHSSGESGEEVPEEDDGDELGDGSNCTAAICERDASTVDTRDDTP
jgi:hypothetical protein